MALKYLLDTSTLSALLGGQYDNRLRRRLRKHRDEVATPAPVWYELWFGCLRMPSSSRRQHLERDLLALQSSRMPILPYDESAAATHAAVMADLVTRGRTPTFVDSQIACIALSHKLVMVTANLRDFRIFPELKVESWLDE